MKRSEIIDFLEEGGPALPTAVREAELKKAFMARAELLQSGTLQSEQVRPSTALRPRKITTFARVAVVAACLLALLTGTALASTYAMPGNPLYSVKRLTERAHLLFLPDGASKAGAYLTYANRRIKELKYAEDRGSENWYFPLIQGALARIESTARQSAVLNKAARKATVTGASRAEAQLEALVNRISPALSNEQRGSIERGANRVRQKLGMPPSGNMNGPGPGGESSPGDSGGQQDGQTGPGQSLNGTEQQGQPEESPVQQQQQKGQQ